MSGESLRALNTHTLIGNTAVRGTAWHYRREEQGAESNHYPGPIPLHDVERRLFNWKAESRPMAVERPAKLSASTHRNADGEPVQWVLLEGRQAIVRSDRSDGRALGVFTDRYEPHQYKDWLLAAVANIVDDKLSISSAGLLRDGAVAWVEISMPKTVETPEGVKFRPNLLATTTFDGSLATTYKRTVTDVVCDNTRAAALREDGEQVKIRHSRNSDLRIMTARDALSMVNSAADDFAADVAKLCKVDVDAGTWQRFVESWVPMMDPHGRKLTGRRAVALESKRESLRALYASDPRVAPWSGTGHGVLQAVNTWEHHFREVRGSRADGNTLRTVEGKFEDIDREAWRMLQDVISNTPSKPPVGHLW